MTDSADGAYNIEEWSGRPVSAVELQEGSAHLAFGLDPREVICIVKNREEEYRKMVY
jgi:hypothetical protein